MIKAMEGIAQEKGEISLNITRNNAPMVRKKLWLPQKSRPKIGKNKVLTFLILPFIPDIISVGEQRTDENAHERRNTGQSLVWRSS